MFIYSVSQCRLKRFLEHQKIYEQNNQTTDVGVVETKKLGELKH